MTKETAKVSGAPFKVLIVDDHPAVREALALRIATHTDLEVCGEASELAEALQVAAATDPDVAVIDIGLKTSSGIDLIKRLKAHSDKIRMIVWSMYSEEAYAERALRAGAMAYLTKHQGTKQIIDAIREVCSGNMYLSAGMTTKLVKQTVGQRHQNFDNPSIETLSDRELEVFRLIGQGLKTQEIATQFHLSVNTVETYRDRIRNKLHIRDAFELNRMALRWALEGT